jgi:hypothetical protein
VEEGGVDWLVGGINFRIAVAGCRLLLYIIFIRGERMVMHDDACHRELR